MVLAIALEQRFSKDFAIFLGAHFSARPSDKLGR
jgi:hypothetical protein